MAHLSTCAVVRDALRAMGGKPARATGASDALGRRSRHQTAVPTEVDGIRFRSGLEAEVFRRLRIMRTGAPGSEILREPRFDLWRTWRPGMGKPLCFTPDFLFVRPRHVPAAVELQEESDDVEGRERGIWVERALDLFNVEVHEAKTARGLESRDYVVRLASFRAEHPTWPITVWRREKCLVLSERLPELPTATEHLCAASKPPTASRRRPEE
jgi:hypothetical protein